MFENVRTGETLATSKSEKSWAKASMTDIE
jgi:hypothetical protein